MQWQREQERESKWEREEKEELSGAISVIIQFVKLYSVSDFSTTDYLLFTAMSSYKRLNIKHRECYILGCSTAEQSRSIIPKWYVVYCFICRLSNKVLQTNTNIRAVFICPPCHGGGACESQWRQMWLWSAAKKKKKKSSYICSSQKKLPTVWKVNEDQ